MGFFSGKDITIVSTSVNKLLDKPPLGLEAYLIKAILAGSSISDTLLSYQADGFNNKVDTYFNYGKNDFIYGLPSASTIYIDADEAEIEDATSLEKGQETTLLNYVIDYPDHQAFVHEWMGNNRSFNLVTNKVVVPNDISGNAEYLYHEMINAISAKISYGYITTYPLLPGTPDKVVTTIVFTETINVPSITNGRYFHIRYKNNSDVSNIVRFWNYRISLDTYPALSGTINSSPAEYYPVVPIRINKIFVNSGSYPALATSSDKLLGKINLNLDHLTEAIASNPDLKEIDDAFVAFAIDIKTTVHESNLYLYNLFTQLSFTSPYTIEQYLQYVNEGDFTTMPAINSFTISDGQYNTNISYLYADRNVVTGSIGEVGTLQKSFDITPAIQVVDYIDGIGISFDVGSYESSKMIIKYQDTPTTYVILTVTGLSHLTNFYRDGVVLKTLADDDGGFAIPLSPSILKDFSGSDEAIILHDSLSLIIYAIQEEHLTWFESSGFVKFITIVITIVSIYYGGIQLQTFFTELINVTLQEAALQVLISSAQALGAALVIDLLVEKLGIFGTIIVIGLSYYGYKAYTTKSTSLSGLPWAEELLKIASAVIDAFNEDIVDELKALQNEQEEFLVEKEERDEELENARNLLDTSSSLFNPLFIMRTSSYFDPYETPSNYFNKAIHITNPGVLSLDAVANYADGQLKLPEFKPASITH